MTAPSRSTAAFALMAVAAGVAGLLFATSTATVMGALLLILAGALGFAGGAMRRGGR